MNQKFYYIIMLVICCFNIILAQDPPPLPDAPNQGPISGLFFLAVGGIIIAAKNYFDRNK